MDVHFLLNAATTYGKNDGPKQRFQEMIEDMHPDKAKDAMTIVGELVISRVRSIITHSNEGSVPLSLAAMIMPPADTVKADIACHKEDKEEPPRKKLQTVITKKRKEIVNDLPDRHLLKDDLTTLEKIKCMKSIYEKKDQWGKLTSGADSFRKKFLNPAMNCLEKHFDSDTDAFCNKWTGFKHTLFPKQCCNGKGTRCAPRS